MIPLVFTLFYGRTFCAGVCPLGAIQDLVAIRPMKLKNWVQTTLGIFPFIYLALGILYAATGTDFIICRYDPFVGIYRFNASFMMFAIGGAFLLAGIFIARPYCRFLCPYGILLNLISRISRKHLSITPAKCINCRLCENSCPYGAIELPTQEKNIEHKTLRIRRVMFFTFLTPVLVISCGWIGARFHENLAMVNPTVRLAYVLSTTGNNVTESPSTEITAFKGSGKTLTTLYAEAASITHQFYLGGWLLGGFLGLLFGLTLAKQSFPRYRTEYAPNKGTCLSCTRCVDFCPVIK
jgi:polyferredoxin